MKTEHVIYLLISLISIVINLLISGIIVFKLKLKNRLDLIIILFITINDIVFYLLAISHIITIKYGLVQFDNKPSLSVPTWYCAFNFSAVVTTEITSIELSALLSIIRYSKICLYKEVTSIRYYIVVVLSIMLSLILSSLHSYYNSYSMHELDFFCLPSISIENNNRNYFLFYFSIYTLRILVSLLIICFCYSKITLAYFRIMDPSIVLNTYPTGLNTRSSDYQFDNNSNKNNLQSNFITNVRVDKLTITQKKQEAIFSENSNKSQLTATQLSLKKAKLALKISVILISYMLCLLPDVIITLLCLVNPKFNKNTTFYSDCLVLCLGLTSACFILLIHQPIQDSFFKMFKIR